MQRRGFHPQDPLVVSVAKAWKHTHELSVRLHYLSCSSGVGRPETRRIAIERAHV